MTIQTALAQGTQLLEDGGVAAPRLTAEVLLAYAVGSDRAWLYAHSDEELREVWWIHYGRYLHQRLQGRPTQYITGRQEFFGREFRVTPDVLIPRPETEHVVEAALQHAAGARRVVDIGTGSGAIAITLALETRARVTATDISPAAVAVAADNAQRLEARVDWVVCDLGAALSGGAFDLVVSNPPYVPASDKSTIQREVRDFEPEVALYGGDDGFAVYRRLVPEAERLLRPGGWLILEIGYASGDTVREMLSGWSQVEIRTDLAGLPRVILAQRRLASHAE
jgi:release factor glutamine methyltransferase